MRALERRSMKTRASYEISYEYPLLASMLLA
jgi:hypothetical protein